MSYATLVNTCNASTLAEQGINKPNYTPRKALKKAFKLLKRVFKPATVNKVDYNNNTEQQITVTKPKAVTENQAEASKLNASILTTCSTLSAEEYENELNELAELAAKSKLIAAE
ncbi:uncharacterized protein LOC128921376 [Zeugodacus cucurbitae]|uniref:Short transient receptor potential channel 4-associated protein n=1 Tax=Zeugodacus cucurbitae TaxID=28588 RepID=A0A0A1WYW2_ZEUCU|nr:uncharacterized protein LOC128921376 [Zeugodacus cucurbitae]